MKLTSADNVSECGNPEKRLANHVIFQAARDFAYAYRSGDKHHIIRECYRFLTGKADISIFWFSVAGVHPFHDIGVDGLFESFKRL